MRLAKNAVITALLTLMLCAVATAQVLRPADDPRNQAPAIGTGAGPSGPTGLFTVYDAQTLRRGEFTFAAAYSSFARDPGDVNITEVPLSFQIGLNNRLELFFSTDAYRGIKVNSPANLSGFYLPNSQLLIGGVLRSPAAIVLSPRGPLATGSINLVSIYRPQGNQPFVQFPYQGGSAGTYGLFPGNPNGVGPLFGYPAGLPQLGIFRSAGGGNFSNADLFPGVGSAFGGILPGIVWAFTPLFCNPGTPPGPFQCGTAPVSFSSAPIYLPDAPFLNRRYGQSAFNTFTVGAKIRLNNESSPFGFALIPFYRFYADNANDFSGFNQLQRGASPGGNFGDIGLIAAFDARLARSVNLSANIGYVWNSNPKANVSNGTFVLLDRPDELQTALAFDFPVNKYFQAIAELRSTNYVGGRTPNALENDPVDVLGGFRIFPARWFSLSLAYRLHLNQQDSGSFDSGLNRTIVVNGGAPGGANATFNQIVNGVPVGMRTSSDPHGFMFGMSIGRRNSRATPPPPNRAPEVRLEASANTVIVNRCSPGQTPGGNCPAAGTAAGVTLNSNASDPDGDTLLYTYNVTGGSIQGSGGSVNWDLSNAAPGTYSVTVQVDDGHGCVTTQSKDITVEACSPCTTPCVSVSASGPSSVNEGTPATFTARLSDPSANVTYNWSVSSGTIIEGQGTSNITVSTAGQGNRIITASVEIGGVAPECPKTSSASTEVVPVGPPPPKKVKKLIDQDAVSFNDDKAQLDVFAIDLQNDPTATGVIVIYAGTKSRNRLEADIRANRSIQYLVNDRGISRNRLKAVVVDPASSPYQKLHLEFWVVPQGAEDESSVTTGREPKPTGNRK